MLRDTRIPVDLTNLDATNVNIADAGDIITATDVEGALQENRTAINLNTTHRSSDGSDHTYIDQDVTSGSFPTFNGTNFTGIDATNVGIADAGDIITATDVEGALQENRTAINLNTTHRSSDGTDHGYINQDVKTTASPDFYGLTINSGPAFYRSSAGIPSKPFQNDFASLDYVNTRDTSAVPNGHLTHVGFDDQGRVYGVWGSNGFIYLANGTGGIFTYNVDGAGYLTYIDSHDPGGLAVGIWGDENFIYLATSGGGLHTYSVDSTSGILTHIDSHDPGDTAIRVWGDGNFIYLANGGGGLHTYSVDSTSGILTHIDSDDQGDIAYGVWGDGDFIYLANFSGGLHTYSVDGSGNLTHIDVWVGIHNAFNVWGDGDFIYLANGGGGINSFSVDSTGVLTFIDSDDPSPGMDAYAVWGDGNFIYLAESQGGICSYSVDGLGNLTHIDSDLDGYSYGIWGDGKFLYLADGPDGLHTYSIDFAGNLTHIDSHDPGGTTYGVWGDSRFIYIANGDGIHSYSVSSSGYLTHLDSDTTNGTAWRLWGDGRFIYLADFSGGLCVYSVDDSGNLTFLDSDVSGNGALGVWGDGRFIYLANYTSGVYVYSVDSSGNLTFIDSHNPGSYVVGVWGDGRFIYLANGYGGIQSYSVDDSGNLTNIDSYNPGEDHIQVWGDGQFIYIANGYGGIHSYSADNSGNLTHIDSDDQGDAAWQVWGDSKFVYLANGTGGLHVYSINNAYEYDKETGQHTFTGDTIFENGITISNYVTVAKSGGQFTSIQSAIDSITDAAADNVYCIKVYPGVYEENIVLKNYVNLTGINDRRDTKIYGTSGTLVTLPDTECHINWIDLEMEPTNDSDILLDATDGAGVTGFYRIENCDISMTSSTAGIKPIMIQADCGVGIYCINVSATYTMTGTTATGTYTPIKLDNDNALLYYLRSIIRAYINAANANLATISDNSTGRFYAQITTMHAEFTNASNNGLCAVVAVYGASTSDLKQVDASVLSSSGAGSGTGYIYYIDSATNDMVIDSSRNVLTVSGFTNNRRYYISTGDYLRSYFNLSTVTMTDAITGTLTTIDLDENNDLNMNTDLNVSSDSSFDGAVTINESGADKDFRVEASGEANALFIQGSDGSIGISESSPNASALLHMTSTSKGFLPPVMTGAQVEAIGSPTAGLLVYATNAGSGDVTGLGWWGWNGSNWIQLG